MAIYNQNSQSRIVFHGFPSAQEGAPLAGYAALIEAHELHVPLPAMLCRIGTRHRRKQEGKWQVFTPRHRPEETLRGHLIFALKYEGVDLALLSALFATVAAEEIEALVCEQPTGRYSRIIWFLWEWLREEQLNLNDAAGGRVVAVLDEQLQYGAVGHISRRHRVKNNLPGNRNFCPLIRRTARLDLFLGKNLDTAARRRMERESPELLHRAAAFLLLKDSRASYSIEGETLPASRIQRWGRILGEAGRTPLSLEKLLYLQGEVLMDSRFVTPGLRREGGFVGEHERRTGEPLPEHISARPEDLHSLLTGLVALCEQLRDDPFDAVLLAAVAGFGFVFIHPFVDGNGRIHRYLFHHILAEKGFCPKGVNFPISAVLLERIEEYRQVLEEFSAPRLELIEWRVTEKNNVQVVNDTINLYRYFDATAQAEFLYDCVEQTVIRALPEEVAYLNRYDQLQRFINEHFEMPDRLIDLLIRFLSQNNGRLAKRRRTKEFAALTEREVQTLEAKYAELFCEEEGRNV